MARSPAPPFARRLPVVCLSHGNVSRLTLLADLRTCLTGDCSLSLFSPLAVVFLFSGFILTIPTLVLAMMVEDLIVLPALHRHRSPEFSLCNSELHPVAPHLYSLHVCGVASAATSSRCSVPRIHSRQRRPRGAQCGENGWALLTGRSRPCWIERTW